MVCRRSPSSSEISISNFSSNAIASSTRSSESKPKSSTKREFSLIKASDMPSCSAIILVLRFFIDGISILIDVIGFPDNDSNRKSRAFLSFSNTLSS